jgi:hypothetical protein
MFLENERIVHMILLGPSQAPSYTLGSLAGSVLTLAMKRGIPPSVSLGRLTEIPHDPSHD